MIGALGTRKERGHCKNEGYRTQEKDTLYVRICHCSIIPDNRVLSSTLTRPKLGRLVSYFDHFFYMKSRSEVVPKRRENGSPNAGLMVRRNGTDRLAVRS